MAVLRVSWVDAAIGAVVIAATVIPTVVEPWWVVVLGILASVPVIWRRRAVLAAGAVVSLATMALALTYRVFPHPLMLLLPYGFLVCVHAFASTPMSLGRRVGGLVFLAVGVLSSLVAGHEDMETYRYLLTAVAAAYAIGAAMRAFRAQRAATRERERRVEEERAAAVERERTRIARDMHDIVTHTVGLMVVQAEAGAADPARAGAVFDTIASCGRDAMGQLRRILDELRSDEPGVGRVPDLVAGACRAGLRATLHREGEPVALPGGADAAAYRVVQEALTNTIRHARAGTVAIRMRWSADALRIEVTDDGHGSREIRPGHGLTGMRERVEGCRGSLALRSDGRGFTVTATLPVGS